jgi:hypothetical protein
LKPSTAKSKGRDTENRVVAYLRSYGLKVERRRLTGTSDQGDIAGWNTDKGSVCVEIKSAATWSPLRWLGELDDEADNCAAETGFVVARPKGKPDPEDYVVLIRLPWFMELMREAGYIPEDRVLDTLAVMRTDALAMRVDAGYPAIPTFRGVPSDGRTSGWRTP